MKLRLTRATFDGRLRSTRATFDVMRAHVARGTSNVARVIERRTPHAARVDRQSGFTFVELLVVCTLLLILAAAIMPMAKVTVQALVYPAAMIALAILGSRSRSKH